MSGQPKDESLLKYFERINDADHVLTYADVARDFTEPTYRDAIRRLYSAELLERPPLAAQMGKLFSADELKLWVTRLGLPPKGKKADLIDAIIKADATAAQSAIKKTFLVVTDAGLKRSEKFQSALVLAERAQRERERAKYWKERLAEYRALDIQSVRIVTLNDDHVCAVCREASERIHTLDEAEAHRSRCVSEDGCRCMIRMVQ
jgi:hypothetical protein